MMNQYQYLTLFLVLVRVKCREIVDLTHTLDGNAPKWPLPGLLTMDKFFNKTYIARENLEHYWLAISTIEFYEHIGTHMDAPIHTAEGKQTVDQIPADKLIGPGVVFNIAKKAQANPDYALTVADIEAYEAEFGRIPDGAIAIINSGWHVKFPRPDLVFGTDMVNDSTTFHFPGYSLEAAQFLLTQRRVRVVGIDTPSIDIGQSVKILAHVYLQSHDVPLLEYVANLDSIPQKGTTIFIGAPKFRDGSGGPTRVLAVIDEDGDTFSDTAVTPGVSLCVTVLFVMGAIYIT